MSRENCEKKGDELSKLFHEELRKTRTKDVKLAVTASYNYLLAKKYDKVYHILEQILSQRISGYTSMIGKAAKDAERTDEIIAIRHFIKNSSWLQKSLSNLVKLSLEYNEKNDNKRFEIVGSGVSKIEGAAVVDKQWLFDVCHYSLLYPKELLEAIELEKK